MPPKESARRAGMHRVFDIFYGDVLIGRSELENGDPPMGVAYGRFEPTVAFFPLRSAMKPARNGDGTELPDMRYLVGVCAKSAEGIVVICSHTDVCEYGKADSPLGWEVSCLGIERTPYSELFPHHVRAYEQQFKK